MMTVRDLVELLKLQDQDSLVMIKDELDFDTRYFHIETVDSEDVEVYDDGNNLISDGVQVAFISILEASYGVNEHDDLD